MDSIDAQLQDLAETIAATSMLAHVSALALETILNHHPRGEYHRRLMAADQDRYRTASLVTAAIALASLRLQNAPPQLQLYGHQVVEEGRIWVSRHRRQRYADTLLRMAHNLRWDLCPDDHPREHTDHWARTMRVATIILATSGPARPLPLAFE